MSKSNNINYSSDRDLEEKRLKAERKKKRTDAHSRDLIDLDDDELAGLLSERDLQRLYE